MRLLIPIIGLLFFACKTPRFNTDFVIDNKDMTIVQNCGKKEYSLKITGKPLDGLYKVIYWKAYAIVIFKNGMIESKKTYNKHKLWDRRKQLNSDTSIYVRYYDKKALPFWSDSTPNDSIYVYSKNYPEKTTIFYKGNRCEYTFDYDALAAKLKIVTNGCELEYIPSELKSAVLNTKCNNNPLTYNTEDREFNKKITVEIINPKDTVYIDYELKENRYSLKF